MSTDIKISLVVAMSSDRVIGKDNQLPWHLPADLAHFKKVTMGKPIIMGRKTWESIGRPLPGRENIVVTSHELPALPYLRRAVGVDEALAIAQSIAISNQVDEVMVIGGAQIFEQLMERCDRIYLTRVMGSMEGDTFFPNLDQSRWVTVHREFLAADARNSYPCVFETLEARGGATG